VIFIIKENIAVSTRNITTNICQIDMMKNVTFHYNSCIDVLILICALQGQILLEIPARSYLENVLSLYFVSRSYFAKSSRACFPSRSIVSRIVPSLGVSFTLKGSGRQFDPLLRSVRMWSSL
jgi:hypothetical protein